MNLENGENELNFAKIVNKSNDPRFQTPVGRYINFALSTDDKNLNFAVKLKPIRVICYFGGRQVLLE